MPIQPPPNFPDDYAFATAVAASQFVQKRPQASTASTPVRASAFAPKRSRASQIVLGGLAVVDGWMTWTESEWLSFTESAWLTFAESGTSGGQSIRVAASQIIRGES